MADFVIFVTIGACPVQKGGGCINLVSFRGENKTLSICASFWYTPIATLETHVSYNVALGDFNFDVERNFKEFKASRKAKKNLLY